MECHLKDAVEEKKLNTPVKNNGRFVKVVSGNPAGRKLGSVNKYTALARELLGSRANEIVDVIIEKALEGDVHCLKMCIDRIIPTRRSESTAGSLSTPKIIINVNNLEQEKIIDSEEFAEEVEFKTEEEAVAEVEDGIK